MPVNATQQARIDEAVARTLAAAPPLTPAQISRLRGLLNTGERVFIPRQPKPRPETEAEKNARLGKLLDERLSYCGACGIPEKNHGYAEHYEYIGHTFTPLSLYQRAAAVEAFVKEHGD